MQNKKMDKENAVAMATLQENTKYTCEKITEIKQSIDKIETFNRGIQDDVTGMKKDIKNLYRKYDEVEKWMKK